MRDEFPNQAVKVAQQVFETMFFATVEVDEAGEEKRDPDGRPSFSWIGAEIGFEGRLSGQMAFFVPAELARTMVANFLGLEEEAPTPSQALDVVGELCNMVCGNLFSKLDRKGVWVLTPPKAWECSEPTLPRDKGDAGISLPLLVEGYPVKLEIRFAP
ncbi:MAG: chemotaxis protein CheX [Desulfobacterota bacterium]|nr:chemotaxis protein CheX [Thermodesulfobacteriota bacterium]